MNDWDCNICGRNFGTVMVPDNWCYRCQFKTLNAKLARAERVVEAARAVMRDDTTEAIIALGEAIADYDAGKDE